MHGELFAARACARAWKAVNTSPALRKWGKDLSSVLIKSKILDHPFAQLDRGFVFIHVPKTAGTSLRQALGLNAPLNIPCHATAQEVLPFIKLVAPKTVSLAFVRNPYSRFVSLYNYARQEESLYHSVRDPAKAPYGKHADFDILSHKTLEECAELLIQGKLGGRHGVGLGQWHPQVEWLMDEENKLAVDYIGRVETLESDLQNIERLYGIISQPIPWLNRSIPQEPAMEFTPRARDLVHLYYKRDFEMLDYDENQMPDEVAPPAARSSQPVRALIPGTGQLAVAGP